MESNIFPTKALKAKWDDKQHIKVIYLHRPLFRYLMYQTSCESVLVRMKIRILEPFRNHEQCYLLLELICVTWGLAWSFQLKNIFNWHRNELSYSADKQG